MLISCTTGSLLKPLTTLRVLICVVVCFQMSRHELIDKPMNIGQDHVAAWDQNQSNSRGKEDTETETDGHRG